MFLNLRGPKFKVEHLCNFYVPLIGSSFTLYLTYYIKKWTSKYIFSY
jgi:hypothetical protein